MLTTRKFSPRRLASATGKQQLPILAPLADGDEGALAGDEITPRAPRVGL
jgi:hypothetical protein